MLRFIPSSHFRRRASFGRLAAAGAVACLMASGAMAQQNAVPTPEQAAKSKAELQAAQQRLQASADARRKLEIEIATIRNDRTKLNTALIETAQKTREFEQQVHDLEDRLEILTGSESAIRDSLQSRKAIIAEVLAALQRMGRKPPPAVLAQPEDMLAAVRTSILLGAVLPELRNEADALAKDLGELVRLKQAIDTDRTTLAEQLQSLTDEQTKVAALMDARQSRETEAMAAVDAERQKMAELGAQTKSLSDLIDRSEREVAGAQRAAEAAKRSEALQERNAFAANAFSDPSRLTPQVPFASVRGKLPLPVSGEKIRDFGNDDGFGGTMRGISLTTRSKAVVVSPADGWVVFSGPFRSFGRLLIINAGGGYYMLLAGMDQINVDVGQFVLAGEPVAVMGEHNQPSAVAGAVTTKDPVLYVELRKDNGSIDPGPWWVKSQSEKVRG